MGIFTILYESKYECTQVYAFTSINKAIKQFHSIIAEEIEDWNLDIIENNEKYNENEELHKIPTIKNLKKYIIGDFEDGLDIFSNNYHNNWDNSFTVTIEQHR